MRSGRMGRGRRGRGDEEMRTEAPVSGTFISDSGPDSSTLRRRLTARPALQPISWLNRQLPAFGKKMKVGERGSEAPTGGGVERRVEDRWGEEEVPEPS